MIPKTDTVCKKCNNPYIQKKGKYSSFLICHTCLELKRIQYNHKVWCQDPNIIIVKKSYDGNTIYAYEQCSSCGFKVRGPISQKGLDVNSLLSFNIELGENLSREIYEEYHEALAELDDLKKSNFFSKYEKYLNSSVWKSKRERVLRRDNYLCQACLQKDATEVHHLTYKHVFDEPLFELTSVCKNCHEKITKMDKEKDKLYGGRAMYSFD